MTDVELQIYKLTEHVANLEAEVALLSSVVSMQPSLRDQLAMAALQGLIARPDTRGSDDRFAIWSYQIADAMLKERGQRSERNDLKKS